MRMPDAASNKGGIPMGQSIVWIRRGGDRDEKADAFAEGVVVGNEARQR
jgi:hypothetical protein